MTLIDTILTMISILLLFWTVYLNFKLRKLKTQIKERKPSIELDEFIADVYSGGGLLRVNRIDQEGLLYRSPRDARH